MSSQLFLIDSFHLFNNLLLLFKNCQYLDRIMYECHCQHNPNSQHSDVKNILRLSGLTFSNDRSKRQFIVSFDNYCLISSCSNSKCADIIAHWCTYIRVWTIVSRNKANPSLNPNYHREQNASNKRANKASGLSELATSKVSEHDRNSEKVVSRFPPWSRFAISRRTRPVTVPAVFRSSYARCSFVARSMEKKRERERETRGDVYESV